MGGCKEIPHNTQVIFFLPYEEGSLLELLTCAVTYFLYCWKCFSVFENVVHEDINTEFCMTQFIRNENKIFTFVFTYNFICLDPCMSSEESCLTMAPVNRLGLMLACNGILSEKPTCKTMCSVSHIAIKLYICVLSKFIHFCTNNVNLLNVISILPLLVAHSSSR